MSETFIPSLTIEGGDEQAGERTLLLSQEFGGDLARIVLHEVHVRVLAEKLGIVPSMSAEAASMIAINFGQASKFAVEARRLRACLARALRLASKLEGPAGEDLADFLKFACEGFDDLSGGPGDEPMPQPPRASNHVPDDLFPEGASA